MSANKKIASKSSREAKRARFDRESRGASPAILIMGLVVMLALIGGALFALTRPAATDARTSTATTPLTLAQPLGPGQDLLVRAATSGHDPYPLVVAEGGVVRLPLAAFDDHKAHYYSYVHEGRTIEFFVLKSKDGIVRAAFNACDVCFAAKKGYSQEGDEMVCNNCGNRFPSDQINEVRGGCNPSPLARTVDGGTVVIQAEDIVAGLDYF